MNWRLTAAWAVHRVAQSVPVAVCALASVAALCIALYFERREVDSLREQVEQVITAARVNPAEKADETSLAGWRAQLITEAGRLPLRKEASALVRSATSVLQTSGVAIESMNTSRSSIGSTGYEVVTLEARITGNPVSAASALSEILSLSPGWSIERLSIERQNDGPALIDVVLALMNGSAL